MWSARPPVGFLAPLAVLVLIAAACGGEGESVSQTTEPVTDVEFTEPPIKIMTIGEFSEGVAIPSMPDSVEGGVHGINRRGGINGSELVWEACDTLNDPNTAAECGRRAVEEGVVALVGGLSVHSGEYMDLMADNHIPVIGAVPTTAADLTSEAAFPVFGGIVSQAAGMPLSLAESGAERIAIARIDLAAAQALQLFGDEALDSYGMEIVADVPIPENTADMAPFVEAVREADADGVVVGLAGVDTANFVIAAKQADPDIMIATVSTTDVEDVATTLGEETVSTLLSTSSFVDGDNAEDSEAYQQYLEDYEAAGFESEAPFRIHMYTATRVFEGIARTLPAGEVTSAAMWEAIPQQTALRTGLTPPIDFSKTADLGVPGIRVFNICLRLSVLDEDGKAVLQPEFIDPFSGEDCPEP